MSLGNWLWPLSLQLFCAASTSLNVRNPFHAMLGLSELLSEALTTQDHPTIARRANAICLAATNAHGLVESLFAWANIQMDKSACRWPRWMTCCATSSAMP